MQEEMSSHTNTTFHWVRRRGTNDSTSGTRKDLVSLFHKIP